jgi:hypothetical protein
MCGRVVDAESNQVVESGTVLLRQTFSESTAFVMEVPYTRGRFQLAVPPGLFSLTVSASGYHVWYGNGSKSQPELFAVEIGDQEEITVRLQSLTSR